MVHDQMWNESVREVSGFCGIPEQIHWVIVEMVE